MAVKFLEKLIPISLLLVQTQAGTISEFLKNSTTSQDIIIEFPSVMQSVKNYRLAQKELSEAEKTDIFVERLKKFTAASQFPFLKFLDNFPISERVTPFWISNKIVIRNVSPALLSALSLFRGTYTIRKPHTVNMTLMEDQIDSSNVTVNVYETQWGVNKTRAPLVWPTKTRGEGVVVANIDSGVNVDHEALKSNYRGGEGSWFDAVNNNNTGPYDDYGQGTHTMGTMCGNSRGIGVAPEAKWIACKALDSEGVGTEVSIMTCAQWMLKPNGDANLKPQIISNSWGSGQNDPWFDDVIAAWHVVDIIPIFAIGNDGSACKTAVSPGDRPGVIGVGSTMLNDTVSDFSSRGTSLSGLLKPDLSAPGDMILSAGHIGETSYVTLSGTGMAASHVAGVAALYLAAKKVKGFDPLFKILKSSSAQPWFKVNKEDYSCGPWRLRRFPNNAYGYGRISVSGY